jgi:Flp pilus assembly protein TadD
VLAGHRDEAERIDREALRLWPHSLEIEVNLADLYRLRAREHESEVLLRDASRRHPDDTIAVQALAFHWFDNSVSWKHWNYWSAPRTVAGAPSCLTYSDWR